MSHTRTHKHTPGQPKAKDRRQQQRRIAEQRRTEADLRERYQADTTAPEPEPADRYVP
jgi:hypothetical protein